MNTFETQNEIQRTGEIVVVSSYDTENNNFIKAICAETYQTNQNIMYGRLEISESLCLLLYGIGFASNKSNFAWELIARKILGYIVLFDWYEEKSFSETKEILDFLINKLNAPILVVGELKNDQTSFQQNVYNPSISLSNQVKFTMCHSSNVSSINKVLVSFLDTLIERMA